MTITSAGDFPDTSLFLLYLTHLTCDPPLGVGVSLTLTLKSLHVHTRYLSSSMFIFSLNLMTNAPLAIYKEDKDLFL